MVGLYKPARGPKLVANGGGGVDQGWASNFAPPAVADNAFRGPDAKADIARHLCSLVVSPRSPGIGQRRPQVGQLRATEVELARLRRRIRLNSELISKVEQREHWCKDPTSDNTHNKFRF